MPTCATHAETEAQYQCDGCHQSLCEECIDESHALLLCRLCGERALPLAASAPATVKERQTVQVRQAATAYGLVDALFYPFRGTGLYLYIAALLSAGLVSFITTYGLFLTGCFAIFIWLGWISLLVGIQFKIVVETFRFSDELPDWPSYFTFGERVVEILTYVVIAGLQAGPLVAYLYAFGGGGLFTTEPSIVFWLGAAACLWLGIGLGVMGWGAAAIHWRHLALRVDLHLKGMLACGADGLMITNITFVLAAAVLILRGVLGGVPILGRAVSGALGIYWAFLAAHLVGLLFRRHADRLHTVYEG